MNEFSQPPTSLLAASFLLNDLCPALLFLRSSTSLGEGFSQQSSSISRTTDLALQVTLASHNFTLNKENLNLNPIFLLNTKGFGTTERKHFAKKEGIFKSFILPKNQAENILL